MPAKGKKSEHVSPPNKVNTQDVKQLVGVKGRWPLPKVAPKIVISSVTLFLLILAGGGLYTYYSDQHVVIDPPKSSSASETSSYTEAQPAKPSPNAPEGVALDSLSTPVTWGSPATLQVSTNPTSECSVTLLVNNIPNPFLGLKPAIADSFGTASWTWTVKNTTPIGTWPLKIICLYNGKTAVLDQDITITGAPSPS